jgi:hypothetical protein
VTEWTNRAGARYTPTGEPDNGPMRSRELSAILARRAPEAPPKRIAADAAELTAISAAAFAWELDRCDGILRKSADGTYRRDFTEADADAMAEGFDRMERRAAAILAPYGVKSLSVGCDPRNGRGAGLSIVFTGDRPPSNSFALDSWEV